MIGPILAIILFVAAGLALSAWSILRRAARGRLDDPPREPDEETHFPIGLDTQAEPPPPKPV
jgi:hypothetical protein